PLRLRRDPALRHLRSDPRHGDPGDRGGLLHAHPRDGLDGAPARRARPGGPRRWHRQLDLRSTAGTFTPGGGSLMQYPDALVALGNGHVLAIGGITVGMMNGVATQATVDTIAEFDPQSGKFTPWSTKLAQSRTGSTAVLARDGNVYVIGGMSGMGKLY